MSRKSYDKLSRDVRKLHCKIDNSTTSETDVSIIGRDLSVTKDTVTTNTPLPSLSGYDVYNTGFYLGVGTDDTFLQPQAGLTNMVISSNGLSISSSIHLPPGLNSFYDRTNGILDFAAANVSDNDFITLDFLYDFEQSVDNSILKLVIEFTENGGGTFQKSLNIGFTDNGAGVDIEQVSRISFFVGPTLTLGTAKILFTCNEEATVKLKTFTIYVHS